MIDKLTRWEYHLKRYCDDDFVISDNGDWCDFDEVKELLIEKEKKTKILLDALINISNAEHTDYGDGPCYNACPRCSANEALEEYKKE